MRTWLNTATTAAILLAGVAAVHQFAGVQHPWRSPLERPHASTATTPSVPATRRGAALARCREHAEMIHDVQWASACMVLAQGAGTGDQAPPLSDDSPDCMLPPERAAVLNAALHAAETRCKSEAAALEDRLSASLGLGPRQSR